MPRPSSAARVALFAVAPNAGSLADDAVGPVPAGAASIEKKSSAAGAATAETAGCAGELGAADHGSAAATLALGAGSACSVHPVGPGAACPAPMAPSSA